MLQKLVLCILLLSSGVSAGQYNTISPIDSAVKARMVKGGSWKKGCPVPLKDLRYLRVRYKDFQGRSMSGEMIVHQSVAEEVMSIFSELYRSGYPIKKMKLVSNYKASDWQSIEAGNTSAFNCRKATGSKKWSKHSYGKAIDINPIENPYISRSGRISHKASEKYRKRRHRNSTAQDKALLLKHDAAVKIFERYGWKWGGDWHGVKDYQHFSK